MTSVAIAVLTYRRPAGLGQLLEGLAALDVPADVALRVVVVDNDPDGSGRAVAEGWAAPLCLHLSYLHPDLNDALCLMTCIAMPGNSRRGVTVLAYDLGIKLGRVERLIRSLSRHGLVITERGRAGGARLARSPQARVLELDGIAALLRSMGTDADSSGPAPGPGG